MRDVEVWQGDCRELMARIPDASVAAIVTDPPYGTQANRDGYGRRQNYGGMGRFIEGDSDLSALDGMLCEADRVLVRDAWLAIFCSPKRHSETAALLKFRGFPVGGEVIWDKASPGLGGGIRYQHETILLAKHGNPTGHAALFSVLRSHLNKQGKHARHPHEKPLDVVRALVRYCSEPGNLILDPFAGSGTTLVACLKSDRRGIGIELDPRWISLVLRRLSEAATPILDLLTP